jgi:hypothetical protein
MGGSRWARDHLSIMNLATKNPRSLRRAPAVGVLLTSGQVISVPVPRSGLRRDFGRVVSRLSSRA